MRVPLIQEIDHDKEAKITIKVQKMRPHGLRAQNLMTFPNTKLIGNFVTYHF